MAKLDWRPWPLRVTWALLPLVLGPLLADALDPRDTLFRRGVSIALWVLWALTLVATAVPRPITLTLVRIVVPASCAAANSTILVHNQDGASRRLECWLFRLLRNAVRVAGSICRACASPTIPAK